MIRFNNDYNQGAHPAILQALNETNLNSFAGYGDDEWCEKARLEIQKYLGNADADIHFMIGGTQTNYTVITAALRPYQSVISADTGHINAHEAGSIEHTGHKILAAPAVDGKLTAEAIRKIAAKYTDNGSPEYLTEPKLVFLSSPSEYGTVYSRQELEAIHDVCQQYGLYLYLDGARLGYWLASDKCDVTLEDIAKLTDVFYIGGTKCGALLGEALVILNPELKRNFRTCMKQTGGILAKGWLLGLQFYTLFKDGLYFEICKQADELAMQLKAAFRRCHIPLFINSSTNQLFVILSAKQTSELSKEFTFEYDHRIDASHSCVRFCTSWSTTPEMLQKLIYTIENL